MPAAPFDRHWLLRGQFHLQVWAIGHVPVGTFNAWGEFGATWWRSTDELYYTATKGGPFSYCSNSSLSYAYSANYVMDDIPCRGLQAEVTSMLPAPCC